MLRRIGIELDRSRFCVGGEEGPIAKESAKLSRVTLQEVARHAQVSPMTLSNFVNGKPRSMSEATRLRFADSVIELPVELVVGETT